MSVSNVVKPIQVGRMNIKHRIAMCPMTRYRAPEHIPSDLMVEFYGQRSSVEGTMMVTEATAITEAAAGQDNVPGIWSDQQVDAWSKVFKGIHDHGSYIFLQLWATGRSANPPYIEKIGAEYIAPSDVPVGDGPKPRPLTKDEIKEWIGYYVHAAKNAIKAGADGVEIHGGYSYLPEQFLREFSNHRTDEYGGSIENRARFALEVIDAVGEAIGYDRVAIRLAPWTLLNGMELGISPVAQYSYLLEELERRRQNGKGLAYIHMIEPRDPALAGRGQSNNFALAIWGGVFIRAGNMAKVMHDYLDVDDRTICSVARHFTSNPDLPHRLVNNIPLTPHDRSTFYTPLKAEGYITWPFSDGFKPGPLQYTCQGDSEAKPAA